MAENENENENEFLEEEEEEEEEDFVTDEDEARADVCRELRRDAEKAGDRELANLYDKEEASYLE